MKVYQSIPKLRGGFMCSFRELFLEKRRIWRDLTVAS